MKQFSVLVVLSMSLAFLQGNAQVFFRKKTQLINVNNKDYSERVEVFVGKRGIRTNDSLIYSWYAFNKVMHTVGAFDGQILHGDYKAFYYSDNLKEKGIYRYGLRSGKWISWYENGNIKDVVCWKNGKKNGDCRLYDFKGEPLLLAHYKNNQYNGLVLTYEAGKQISSKKYKNGIELLPAKKELITHEKKVALTENKAEVGESKKVVSENKKTVTENKKEVTSTKQKTKSGKWKEKVNHAKTKVKSWFKKKDAPKPKENKPVAKPLTTSIK